MQFQEVSTQQGYAIWAPTYDSEKNPLIAVEELHVDALIATLPMTTALDVGTGTGRHALKLARRGVIVTAIDQSPEMLAVAMQTAYTEGIMIDFQHTSLSDNLPFDSGHFDFIICALMLCHVPDLVHAIQEFFRVLQPGGFLLISDFHPDAVGRGWRTHFRKAEVKYSLPNIEHTRADYLESLAAGFSILKVLDIPVCEVPIEYFPESMHEHGDKELCLIILAQKLS